MAKTKEAQAKEREKMETELALVKERVERLKEENEELDKKLTSATIKVTELSQDLEVSA